MGSIPLTALQVKPPESPVEQYTKAVQLKTLLGGQQLQQQELNAGAIGLQEKQQQLKDQQAQTAAMREWDGNNLDAIPGLILKHGGSAQVVMATRSGIVEQKAKQATLDKATLENEKARHDTAAQAFDNVSQLPPEQQPQAFEATKANLVTTGKLQPQEAQGFVYQNPDQLKITIKGLRGYSNSLEDAAKAASTAEASAKAKQATAEAAKTNLEADQLKQYGGLSPAAADARYRFVQQKLQQKQFVSADDQAFAKAYEKQKTLVPVANFNLQNAGATGGGNGQPSALAQAVAKGDMKWSDVISPRTPMSVKQQFAAEVKSINPNFNSGDFSIEQSVRKDFTSGAAAKNLTAFNTAIEHSKQLQQAADALDNGDMPTANKIGNALGYQFGSDKMTNFNVIKNALSGEISKVFKGGQATDSEIKAVEEPFSSANSPAQLKGAINNAIKLMDSKRNALQGQYDAGRKGQPNFGEPAPQTHTFSVGAWRQANPKGNPDQAAAAAKAQGYQVIP